MVPEEGQADEIVHEVFYDQDRLILDSHYRNQYSVIHSVCALNYSQRHDTVCLSCLHQNGL